MKIEKIRLKNFKVFQDVTIENIPAFCVIVGANGAGKTTLFDVFGFLKDCLTYNVTRALRARGGFQEVVSRGHENESIELEIQYRLPLTGKERLVTYLVEIGLHNKCPAVVREVLRYKRGAYGSPYQFLKFAYGKGEAVTNEEDFSKTDEELNREEQDLGAVDILAIKGLGQFQKFKAANALRQMIESWHVSDFHIDAARGAKEAVGEYEHLSASGDNLQQVALNLFENHRDVYERILEAMRQRVPGVNQITTQDTVDGRLVLQFGNGIFKDPFIDRFVSDGTLKMFAYLVLLHDPRPHPFLCVEEPENQLYPRLLPELAEEFRTYSRKGGQVMVSTHSPDFLNATEVGEVFWLEKGEDGFSKVCRAADDAQVVAYMEEGDKMGYLWNQGLFGKADPQ
ncbi:AAA family ATPase [Desulfovibrio piger]|uniref:AAA family ATPase n=2 Tax=Desulfovibrio TaxID=872 RepID=UPI00195C413D|nr:AAA family ATPase [Desulfovibrio piger]MBM6893477.1 AAA family ATPase [Desulfovibrio piger]